MDPFRARHTAHCRHAGERRHRNLQSGPPARGTLGALAAQQVPRALEWEIVVVDNNSTDATAQAVAAFSPTTAIPVRYVFEPRQGISAPGIAASGKRAAPSSPSPTTTSFPRRTGSRGRGRDGSLECARRGRPDSSAVGIRRPAGSPRTAGLLRLLALMEPEESGCWRCRSSPQPQVWGANMAFRRELFDRVGEFDPRRGIMGEGSSGARRADLIERALELGLKIAYDPALTVFHRIGPDRMRKAYFRRLEFEARRAKRA